MDGTEEVLISVIVPVYKVEKYLSTCIDSILEQTYKNLEIILVDDGSPDRCPEICDDYSRIDSRVKVIHKKNEGLSSARNEGIRIAKGEYLTFVDSDDYISKDMIRVLYEICCKYHVLLAQCNHTTKSAVFDTVSRGQELGIVIRKERCMNELFGKFGVSFCVSWGKLFHRTLLETIEFPVGKLHEDVYTTHLFFEAAESLVFTTKCLYYYRQRKDSLMGYERRRPAWNELKANMTRAAYFKKKGYLEVYRKQLWVCVCDLRRQYNEYYEILSSNRKRKMKKVYRKIMFELIKQKKRDIPIEYWILGGVNRRRIK